MVIARRIYERFGSYLLFKKLESDVVSELFRAGRIEGDSIAGVVALRRLTGGDREAFRGAVEQAKLVAPLLTGTTIVRNQMIESIDGVPTIVHEYVGGRSLRHIIDKGKATPAHGANPLPTDQAVAITEKLALSLEMIGNLKYQGSRLLHGALLPQFIWIAEDGEVRTSGQQLGRGFIASLRDPKIAKEIGGFFAPEIRSDLIPTKASEAYSLGAMLYLCITGENPPDPTDAATFESTISTAKLNGTDALVPDDIRAILARTLVLDPAKRFGGPSDVRQALGSLVHGGKYAPTTFNLAFYLSTLLKKELESEADDRERESKVNVATYIDAPDDGGTMASAHAPTFGGIEQKKSRVPLIAAVVAGVAIIGAAAFYFISSQRNAPKKPAPAMAVAKPAAPPPSAGMASAAMAAPIIATTSTAPATTATSPATSTATDPEARKKAIEEEVNRRLQEEMIKLQQDYDTQLKKEKKLPSAPPPVSPAPVLTQSAQPVRVAESRPAPTAEQLDEKRRAQSQPVSQPVQTQPVEQSVAAPPPAPVVPEVKEGDLVEIAQVDAAPRLLTPIRPTYPPMAERAHVEGSVILSVLVSEKGRVLDVKVLRGDAKMGFDDSAMRAIRSATFAPATKNGKRVRTWTPIPVRFKL